MDVRIVEQIHAANHWLYKRRVPVLPAIGKAVLRVVFGLVLPPSVVIGKETRIGYQGLGTVIHARAVIGDRVTLASNVTIGGREGRVGVPVIGDDVMIGTGARVLGPVRIGNGARIGANAVVLADVPDHAVFAGVPARAVRLGGGSKPPVAAPAAEDLA